MAALLNAINERNSYLSRWASQIEDGWLWLGSGRDAMNLEELEANEISM
jgi:hypothetical protein